MRGSDRSGMGGVAVEPVMPPVPSVAVLYNTIPRYRGPVFASLARVHEYRFEFWADRAPDTAYVPTIDGRNSEYRFPYRNLRRYDISLGGKTLYLQPKAIRWFLTGQVDALICLGTPYSATMWILLLLGRMARKPVLLWTHGMLRRERGPKLWSRLIMSRMSRGVLLYGERARRLMVQSGVSPEKLRVIWNSLDATRQLELAQQAGSGSGTSWAEDLGVPRSSTVLVFVGRLQPVKRLDVLVDVVVELAERGCDPYLLMVGEGELEHELRDKAEACGVSDRCRFLGPTYDDGLLSRVYSVARATVIPSGAGLTVMQSLAFGVPVVIPDDPDIHFPEQEAVIDGVSGIRAKSGSPEDLADAVGAVLRRPIGFWWEGARRVISKRYNPQHQTDAILRALDDFGLREPASLEDM